jgi:transposase InsO family protein
MGALLRRLDADVYPQLKHAILRSDWLRTLHDVRSTLATWREEYNCERPHSSLDYRTPQEFRHALEGSKGHGPAPSANINHQQERESPVMNGYEIRG